MRKTVPHIVWTIGLAGGLGFLTLRFLGSVDVSGYKIEKFIPSKKGLLVIYRHPSLVEPALIPFLFFPVYLFYPKSVPFSAPDKKN